MSAAFAPLCVVLGCVYCMYGVNYIPNKVGLCFLEALYCLISKTVLQRLVYFYFH